MGRSGLGALAEIHVRARQIVAAVEIVRARGEETCGEVASDICLERPREGVGMHTVDQAKGLDQTSLESCFCLSFGAEEKNSCSVVRIHTAVVVAEIHRDSKQWDVPRLGRVTCERHRVGESFVEVARNCASLVDRVAESRGEVVPVRTRLHREMNAKTCNCHQTCNYRCSSKSGKRWARGPKAVHRVLPVRLGRQKENDFLASFLHASSEVPDRRAHPVSAVPHCGRAKIDTV